MIMVLQSLANFQELCISFRELFLHLSDGHRSTNTSNYVLALCIDQELTHQFVLTCSRVTGKCNTGTGLVV